MKCDVKLDNGTYVGVVGRDEEEIKEKVRHMASLSDYGVSKLILVQRLGDLPYKPE